MYLLKSPLLERFMYMLDFMSVSSPTEVNRTINGQKVKHVCKWQDPGVRFATKFPFLKLFSPLYHELISAETEMQNYNRFSEHYFF